MLRVRINILNCVTFNRRVLTRTTSTISQLNSYLLVTNAIDKIMTGEDLEQQDLVISKLLRQDIEKYKSLFAIQLYNNSKIAT